MFVSPAPYPPSASGTNSSNSDGGANATPGGSVIGDIARFGSRVTATAAGAAGRGVAPATVGTTLGSAAADSPVVPVADNTEPLEPLGEVLFSAALFSAVALSIPAPAGAAAVAESDWRTVRRGPVGDAALLPAVVVRAACFPPSRLGPSLSAAPADDSFCSCSHSSTVISTSRACEPA